MKVWMSLIVIAFFNYACHHATAPSNETKPLTTTFTLTDTAGRTSAQLHSGESFLLSFAITNNTPDTITYHFGMFPIYFQILKTDSLITGSFWGCYIETLAIPIGIGKLPPNQTLQNSWRAPTPICQSMMATLVPGIYQACVSFPTFDGVNVDSVAPIPFTVIP